MHKPALVPRGMDGFVLCFAVDDIRSYDTLRKLCLNIRGFGKPFIVLALKTDLRNLTNTIPEIEGHRLAEELGANGYAEASALQGTGLPCPFLEIWKAYVRTGGKQP